MAAAAAATVPFQNMKFLLSVASQSEKNANLKQLKLISQYVYKFPRQQPKGKHAKAFDEYEWPGLRFGIAV